MNELRSTFAIGAAGERPPQSVTPPPTAQALVIDWDRLHIQSRQEICRGAAVGAIVACSLWNEIEPWLRGLLEDSFAARCRRLAFLRRH